MNKIKIILPLIFLFACSPRDIAVIDEVIEGEAKIVENALNEEFSVSQPVAPTPPRPSVNVKKF